MLFNNNTNDSLTLKKFQQIYLQYTNSVVLHTLLLRAGIVIPSLTEITVCSHKVKSVSYIN